MRLASLTRFCAPYRARIVPLRHVAERRCLVLTGVDTLIFLTISSWRIRHRASTVLFWLAGREIAFTRVDWVAVRSLG